MGGFVCACASEICAAMGCQRMKEIRDKYAQSVAGKIPASQIGPCNCIGPQAGQPLCPCQMRGVVVKNGRYVRPEQDLGPA